MKKLPIGIQDFRKLREFNGVYVDKTALIAYLVERVPYAFLSRPRRFGKSLTLSVIKELHSGDRSLFEGLWVVDNWDWEAKHRPVLHFSMSTIGYQDMGLEVALHRRLEREASSLGIELQEAALGLKFQELLRHLSAEQGKVVLLIDEYDKPLIDYLDQPERAREHQRIFKSFYSIIKDSDPYLEFLLITGVSKFSKFSIFSDLNNLQDITLHPKYATLTGYTQEELEDYFSDYLQEAAAFNQLSKETLLERVREWYNGYSWDGRHFVYNPFSVLSFCSALQFSNFWFSTGTPTVLIRLLKDREMYDLAREEVSVLSFDSYDIDHLQVNPLLFQTGYLTIKKMNAALGVATLDYPNREVRGAFYSYLIGAYRENYDQGQSTPLVVNVMEAFQRNDLEAVIAVIRTLFKTIPSHIFLHKAEAYYHSLIHLLFNYLGVYVQSEVNTSNGRLDAAVHTDTHIYVLEYKLDQSAAAALAQIQQRGYVDIYRNSSKQLIGLGINMSSHDETVDDWAEIIL